LLAPCSSPSSVPRWVVGFRLSVSFFGRGSLRGWMTCAEGRSFGWRRWGVRSGATSQAGKPDVHACPTPDSLTRGSFPPTRDGLRSGRWASRLERDSVWEQFFLLAARVAASAPCAAPPPCNRGFAAYRRQNKEFGVLPHTLFPRASMP